MIKERIIWLFIITTMGVWAVNRFVPRSKDSDLQMRLFWIKKTFAEPVYDVVLIGDSRVYRGIDPETIRKYNKGCKVLNFGYSSAGLTPKFIDEGVAKLNPKGKKVIVLCVSTYTLTPLASLNKHYAQESTRKREEVLEAKYFSGVKYFFRPVNPQYWLDKRYLKEKEIEKDSLFYHEEYMPDGWVASWKLKRTLGSTLQAYKKEFKNNLPSQNRANLVLQKAQYLKSKGYRVVFTQVPIHPALLQLEQEYAKNIVEKLKSNVNKSNMVWLNLPDTTYYTYDGSHLLKREALSFSTKLGIALQAYTK